MTSRVLDDFVCLNCGHRDEFFHRRGEDLIACPGCSTDDTAGIMRRLPPRTQVIDDFGSLGKHYKAGVRLSAGQRDARDHWVRSRFGDKAPKDPNPRPTHFS